METSEMNIKLTEEQKPAYLKHTEIIPKYFSAINTAPPGAGKSYTTMAAAITYKFVLFIVCPANAVSTWEEYVSKYNIQAIIISYNKLIIKGKQSNNAFLCKTYDKKYEVTNKFKELLKSQILLIFDESQHAKNPINVTCKACHILANAVKDANNGSRILLLSATPVDIQPFVESILKLMGIITTEKLYRFEPGKKTFVMNGYGYEELYRFCYDINPKLAIELRPKKLSASSIKESMYKLYTEVVNPTLGFTMSRPNIKAKFTGINKSYKASDDETTRINKAIDMIKRTTNYNNGTITYQEKGMTTVMEYMKIIEVSKLSLFKRIIKDTLDYIPNSKVIMYVWYNITVDELLKEFKDYKPLRCDGKVTQKVKTENRKLFQQPNLNYRLLIAKATSFGDCVSLHDDNTLGLQFPRHTFINPSFFFNYIVQASGRTYRVGTVSDVNVTLTYCQGTDEKNVVESIKSFNIIG